MEDKNNNLINCIDSLQWAEQFINTVNKNPDLVTDLYTLNAWFANAIMAGYDKGYHLGYCKGLEIKKENS